MHAKKGKAVSMNLPGYQIGACLGKAALKAHALQTLRDCLSLRTARSVWSASDLSALSVARDEPAVHTPIARS